MRMDDEPGPTGPESGEAGGEASAEDVPLVGALMQRTTRFSRDVVATMISLASAAFGVVAALAWNAAITTWFDTWLKNHPAKQVSALFVYAVIVTLIGVVVIVALGRLAGRLRAQPVEFKYPAAPK